MGTEMVFLKLLNMGIAAGWLILAVILLRLVLKRTPKWAACALWATVAIRLLCPFSFQSPLSLIPSAETISLYTVRFAQKPSVNSGIPLIDRILNPSIGEAFAPNPGASVNPLYIWFCAAGAVWAAGAFALLLYALAGLFRIRRRIQASIPFRDNIWLCDAVQSPFILGILRPQIILPSSVSEEQLPYVLAHEQAHLKRKDHWWKPLAFMLLATYWFHPLIWAAYILFCRDLELACDEKAIKGMDFEQRKVYSRALVSCSMRHRIAIACPPALGEINIKKRVRAVLHYKKPALWACAAAAVACAATAMCFLTDPQENAPNQEYEGRRYGQEELSAETAAWLTWYNQLSEEDSLSVKKKPGSQAGPWLLSVKSFSRCFTPALLNGTWPPAPAIQKLGRTTPRLQKRSPPL